MDTKRYVCGKYSVTVATEGRGLEAYATVNVGNKTLRSSILNVNGIMSQILTEDQMDFGGFDDSWFEFETSQEAGIAFGYAIDLFSQFHEDVEEALDDDRLAGEWEEAKPQFSECGCCGAYHRVEFNGDCRNDAERFAPQVLDEKYGVDGWEVE